ncbi:MAG TPA: histidinol-phosphate transaminase [Candidatus Limnocylindrales bacterium]|nr:histidinol-phosphate transaminase [Candidatus Limnocylindrales bacterium]
MSPSPFAVTSPTDPASYSWEATDEGVAARFGIPVSQVLRFDLNTSPAPPAMLAGILAANRFETSLSEYPPGDYRRLAEAAAARYGVAYEEIVPGAGADEILDMCTKAFLPAGQAAVISIPTYAMYRVHAEQRGARVIPVPRLPQPEGWAMDVPAVRTAAREATLVWICNPNNPTGLPEPDGAIETLLAGIAADAGSDGRPAPAVVVDEAYSEFTGESLVPLRHRYRNLVCVRTASKAYALAGLRVGFAVAAPETIERIARYRPPGSIGTISATVVAAALADTAEMEANVERVQAERPRLAAGLREAGFGPQPSVTNFILCDVGTAERSEAAGLALMQRGLVPRTFGHGHPLAHCIRVTVRAPHENDRLVEAALEIGPTLPPLPRPAAASPDPESPA